MFEHKSLDGAKIRALPATQPFLQPELLEIRDPKNGEELERAARTQYAVINGVLVERYLPPESVGDAWPHDKTLEPWWEVVGHPPHGGIVADYNAATGGTYRRVLKPDNNVVAYAQFGEEVTMGGGCYSVVRQSDGQSLSQPSLLALRTAYYAA